MLWSRSQYKAANSLQYDELISQNIISHLMLYAQPGKDLPASSFGGLRVLYAFLNLLYKHPGCFQFPWNLVAFCQGVLSIWSSLRSYFPLLPLHSYLGHSLLLRFWMILKTKYLSSPWSEILPCTPPFKSLITDFYIFILIAARLLVPIYKTESFCKANFLAAWMNVFKAYASPIHWSSFIPLPRPEILLSLSLPH